MSWWCGAAAGCWPPPLRAGEGSGPGAGAKAAVACRGPETPALPHSRGCIRLGVTPGSPATTCELSVATWARPRACAAECPLSAPFSQDPPRGPLAACPGPRALRGGSAALFEGSARDTSGLCGVRGTLVRPSLERGVEHFRALRGSGDAGQTLSGERGVKAALGERAFLPATKFGAPPLSPPSSCVGACFLLPAHIPRPRPTCPSGLEGFI